MLLQRLVEYARTQCVSKPFHKEREFTWRLELSSTGAAPDLVDLREPNDRGKISGQRWLTPSVTRTGGVAPHLGADDVQYVLGWGDETTKPERVDKCHAEFVALIDLWAQSGHDPAVGVVRDFYTAGGPQTLRWPVDFAAKQGVLIAVDGKPVIEHESLIRFWTDEVARRKGSGTTGICLVCGQDAVLVETVPGNISERLVPGAANNAALVSVNKRVFGYGLSTGLANTPICFGCGDAMNTALTDLLSGPHVIGLQQQDSAMTWWALGAPTDDFFLVMPDQADPDAVARLLSRLHSGTLAEASRMVPAVSGDRFCSVTLGGNSSRIMIRDWVDMPLQHVMVNLARWYDDHRVHTLWDDEPVSYSLRALVLATGRWEPGRNRYSDLGSTSARRPEHIARDLIRTSVRKAPLPPSVLQHVLHRISNDGRIDGPRAALLRLALRRHPTKEIPMPAGLDETSEDPAYVAGRVFAQYEKIQYAANNDRTNDGDNHTINATFTDRHFSGAISNPHPALMAGSKLLNAWLAKIRRRPSGGGLAHVLAGELDQLLHKTQVIPNRLRPDEQARFVLGYHHQRAHDAAQRRAHQAGK
ncbi:type I-C CRISPR-associated protein Cas8c/Csd1 [Saccharopolyspora hattusasensis]|uniref:type I-C CRISPR-associated protein Cas8c/Csd1 n=1 Tax=Saccharopolyspora hattusasensis TaxID=1128679 RepID=UPI003D9577C6